MSKIILEEQAAPSTPAANKVSLYPKAGGGLYKKDDAGVEKLIGTGDVTAAANITANTVVVGDNGAKGVKGDISVALLRYVGEIFAWSTETAPTGSLECNGAAVNRSTYSALFAIISDDYGNGDGSTTFNLPDLRGRFLRGWDHGAGTDPDAATRTDRGDSTTGDHVGTKQPDAFQGHKHSLGRQFAAGEAVGALAGGNNETPLDSRTFSQTTITDGTNGTPRETSETRSININVMYCIKY